LTEPRSVPAAPGAAERAAGGEPAARAASAGLDTQDAHELLSDLGFLLVHGRPLEQGASYLLVAIRPKPTLVHFDPERIEYWAAADAQAEELEIVWPVRSASRQYTAGSIRVVDRVGASNSFISFGGELSLSRDGDVGAALFRSSAPILALHGRSGPADPMAANMYAFVAVLRGAQDNDRDLARAIYSATPRTLYGAFIERTLRVYRAAPPRIAEARLASLLRMERNQLEAEAPTEMSAGRELAARL
jgi:hypothetical protein